MKVACFIPIKSNSERIPGKNFKMLCGKPLYQYIIDHAIAANCFDFICVDTNSFQVQQYCDKVGVHWIEREAELASNSANGNDLLSHHFQKYPNFDFYFQLFATAPFLQPGSISKAVACLTESIEYDSVFTVLSMQGFFWHSGVPVNYRPCILPRSQDMCPVIEETTGLYGISGYALAKYRSRIGSKPYFYEVSKFEAVDINTEEDLRIAEFIGASYWKYNS